MNNTTLIIGGILALGFFASLLLLARSEVARVIASIFALGASAFCAFGFLASFEYSGAAGLPPKVIYATLGICLLATAVMHLKSVFKKKDA